MNNFVSVWVGVLFNAHLREAAGRDLEDEQFATRMSPVW